MRIWTIMGTKEIPNRSWDAFCRRISELRNQALLTIEVVGSDGQRREIARNVPLQKLSFQQTDGCNDQIALDFGEPGTRPATHLIIEPIQILLRPAESGSYNPMEIDAENGTTLLTFHPAVRADFLETAPA